MDTNFVNEEKEPTGDGARSERSDWRALRRLDAEIAERVMGWTRYSEQMHPSDNRTIDGVLYCPPGFPETARGGFNCVPCYSSDIGAAMQVAEQMRFNGCHITITIFLRVVFCWVETSDNHEVEGESEFSVPLAICRAALALVDGPRNQEGIEKWK